MICVARCKTATGLGKAFFTVAGLATHVTIDPFFFYDDAIITLVPGFESPGLVFGYPFIRVAPLTGFQWPFLKV